MTDIAPELFEIISDEFYESIETSTKIKALEELIQKGTATYVEAEAYADEIGSILSDAFHAHLSSNNLPDGKMYQNIADRVVRPLLEDDYRMSAEMAAKVQQSLNESAGLGLKALKSQVNTDRIDGIVNKVVNAEQYDDVAWVLGEPVKNFSISAVDDTLKTNIEFQGKAGRSPKIIRIAEIKCCEWCSKLEGEYEYPNAPADIYRRHENCRCTVDYEPGNKKRQNAHTKSWKTPEEIAKIEQRKQIGLREGNVFQGIRGSGGGRGTEGQSVHRVLGKVDPTDTTVIEKLKTQFTSQYASSPVEHMMVITKNGEVHYITDNNARSVNSAFLGNKLNGSYNIHTHPPDTTQFSFSTDADIPAAFADGTAVMDAVDYKYTYRFVVPGNITFEQWDAVRYEVEQRMRKYLSVYRITSENYEENIQHILIDETCKALGLDCYTREVIDNGSQHR